MSAACINNWLLTRRDKKIWAFWKKSQRHLNEVGVCSHKKKMKQVPGGSRESVGVSQKLVEWRVLGGRWSQALLRLYAFWQVQFQEYVNDSYDVWSPFHYIPNSHHYIRHIKCRVCNWLQYFMLCLCSVWKHIIYWHSEHRYLYWETASYFCSLWPSLDHKYSIVK